MKKNYKKPIPFFLWTLILVFISLTLSSILATGTYAWFAINDKVEATGVQLITEVSPNLLISTSSSSIKTRTPESSSAFAISAVSTPHSFLPCTHYVKDSSGKVTAYNQLKYLVNTADVNRSTGLTSVPIYADVPTDSSNLFYVDYTVYLASYGKAMSNAKLTASISAVDNGTTGLTTEQLDIPSYKAASIDFYKSSTFRGTLNLAGLNPSTNNGSTKRTSITIQSSGSIPQNTSSYIKVKMRFYFDGALLKSTGQAFVNTDTVTPNNVIIKVTFTATEIK